MTREEAIAILETFMENPLFSDEHKQAFNIAIHDIKQRHEWDINKLMLVSKTEWEQEPTTKNDLGVDREDAVERLNAIKQLIGYDKDSEIVKATQKSLDMAIKALEHPEKNVVAVVPCGDCISREQALKELKESAEHHANDSREEALLRRDRDIIRALPSVTPQEPRQGHWKFQKITQGKRMWCSHCNSVFDLCCSQIKRYNEATRDNDIWAYCPWCGARMIESQESEG